MPLPKVKISVRKMGTRFGEPHYGSECVTCGTVLVAAHASRDTAKRAGEVHKAAGCRHTHRYYSNVS